VRERACLCGACPRPDGGRSGAARPERDRPGAPCPGRDREGPLAVRQFARRRSLLVPAPTYQPPEAPPPAPRGAWARPSAPGTGAGWKPAWVVVSEFERARDKERESANEGGREGVRGASPFTFRPSQGRVHTSTHFSRLPPAFTIYTHHAPTHTMQPRTHAQHAHHAPTLCSPISKQAGVPPKHARLQHVQQDQHPRARGDLLDQVGREPESWICVCVCMCVWREMGEGE